MWGLLSARVGAVSVAALPVLVAPKGGFFLALGLGSPAMSLSDRCSGSKLVCVSVCLCVSLAIYGGGRVVFLIYFLLLLFIHFFVLFCHCCF